MSDYKRLVAYVYLYDRGVRAKNIGYAKVESREGRCRIYVYIKGARMEEGEPLCAYVFYRKGREIKGIRIGEISLKNGAGELKVHTDAGNLMGSGLAISHMSGIIIRSEEDHVIATRWDDGPIAMEMFSVHGEPDRREQPQNREPEAAQEEVQQTEMITESERPAEEHLYLAAPADLPNLTPEGRYLLNNSFLLHGFYNYRHLLIKEMPDQEEILLGVPGDFCPQEQVMAALFGFPEFGRPDGEPGKHQNTGYWLRRIKYEPTGKIHEGCPGAGEKSIQDR